MYETCCRICSFVDAAGRKDSRSTAISQSQDQRLYLFLERGIARTYPSPRDLSYKREEKVIIQQTANRRASMEPSEK